MAEEPDKTLFGRPPAGDAPATDPVPIGPVPPTSEMPRSEAQRKQAPTAGPDDLGELLAVLRRMEASLQALRGHLEATGRERRYREFSAARLIGALLEILVLGFVVAALADWVYHASYGEQLVKLGLAGVLQMGALTAFWLGRAK